MLIQQVVPVELGTCLRWVYLEFKFRRALSALLGSNRHFEAAVAA